MLPDDRVPQRIAFGDNVRVRAAPPTEAAGVAGLVGNVHGETTPSVTNIEVIGICESDYAICVYFEARAEQLWFAPGLLEFVDHGVGGMIQLDGARSRFVRTADGQWREEPLKARKGPWWKLW